MEGPAFKSGRDSKGTTHRVLDKASRLAGFVEDIPFGVWICDAGGGLQYASESFLQLLDMSMEEASGFGWTKRLVTEDGDSLARWQHCVERENDWDDEHQIRDRQGNVRTLLARGHAVRDESGTITSWVGVHIDITQRKNHEERLRMLKLVQGRQQERERIAQRLHDHLQQLLIGADLQLSSVRQGGTDEQKLDYVGDILNQAIEASRNLAAELNPPVLYDSGLSAAFEWLARFMEDTYDMHVELDLGIEHEPDSVEICVVLFDAVRELLVNVVKHARVQDARVLARSHDGRVQLVVEDRGAGFDTEAMGRDKDPAAGLGLSGIRRRIEALGGKFEVRSQPGAGTTVQVTAPLTTE